ncbi:uncharacterized protein ATNIH1004_011509 [Aspergillus tanneri]|uniref:SNF2 N-terminal domain-containing protein n=1 Tax=Aspergillus tanneri TaxID=1220188 RepID=A0A5M9MB93_9EURO|nr:uncharacterized protein ATNIH1004_011509 [Aspergillus tanneri]KAA8642564.1 hypothetical protein ATNIH1004_011509 [Aspergillus tanneri]
MPDNWKYSLAGLFNLAVFDETHTLRNPTSSHSCFQVGAGRVQPAAASYTYNAEDAATAGYGNEKIFQLPAGHEFEAMLTSEEVVEQWILHPEVGSEVAGQRMRWILELLMIRRTLTSEIPFNSGHRIGSDIPGAQKQIVSASFDDYERATYKAAEKNIFGACLSKMRTQPGSSISTTGNCEN